MKHLKFFLAFLVALLTGANSSVWAAVGNTFTATSIEGVSVTYQVLTESGTTGTVQVGIGEFDKAAVPEDTEGSVTIPETVTNGSMNYTVTCIADWGFYSRMSIESVVIPNTVTKIGRGAFGNCTLTSLYIPASVIEIGWRAFYSCPYLNTITVDPDNTVFDSHDNCNAIIEKSTKKLIAGSNNTVIPSDVLIIGEAAFGSRSGLTSVTLPEGLTTLDEAAFTGCHGLTSIDIPNTVTSIGRNAFERCSRLTSVSISNSVNIIDMYTFIYCSSLKTVTCNCTNPPTLGTQCFDGISNNPKLYVPEGCVTDYQNSDWSNYFTRILNIGDKSLEIGDTFTSDLSNGVSLTYQLITSNTVKVYAYAYNSTEPVSLVIPETVTYSGVTYSVTAIKDACFNGFKSLTSVSISKMVASIGYQAFNGCSDLNSITVDPDNAVYDSRNDCNAIIETATNTLLLGCKNTEIPNTVTAIADAAFYGCSGLTSVSVPNSVVMIGYDAFGETGWYNSQPDGLVYAGLVAYQYKGEMPSNTSIVIAEGTKGITSGAFYDCTGLISVTIPSSVTYIGEWVFEDCGNLTDFTCYAQTPPELGNGAFYGTAPNPTLYVPYEEYIVDYQKSAWSIYFTKIRVIGDTSFGLGDTFTAANDQGVNVTYMITGTNPNTVKTYGYWDDESNSAVTAVSSDYQGSLIIPETVTYQDVTYTVTEIGDESFDAYNLNLELTEVTLPSTITAIGYYAFDSSTSVTKMNVLATNPPTLADNSLYLSDNAILYVPEGCKTAYENSAWAEYFSRIKVIGDVSVEIGETFELALQDSKNSNLSMTLTYMITAIPEGDQNGTVQIGTGNAWACGDPDLALFNLILPETVTYQNLTFDVTRIGDMAFSGFAANVEGSNVGLESVSIPVTVNDIGQEAFSNCYVMTKVYSYAVEPPTLGNNVFTGINSDAILNVPEGSKTNYEYSDWSNYFSSYNIVESVEGKIKIAGVDIDDGIPYSNQNGVTVTWDNDYKYPIITLNNANLTNDAGPAIEINSYDRVDIYLIGDNVVSSTAPNSAAISIGTKDGVDKEGCSVMIGKVSEGYYYDPIDYDPASLTVSAKTSMGIYSYQSNITMADITANIAGQQYGVYVKGTYEEPIAYVKAFGAPKRSQSIGMPLFGMYESMELNLSGGTAAFMAETESNIGLFEYSNKLLDWEPAGVTPEFGEYDENMLTLLVGNTPATSLHFGHEYFVRYTTEGVPMKFTILDEEKKTCQVYASYDDWIMKTSIPVNYQGPITIPETIDYDGTTYTVTKIANYAFNDCRITSVVIPASVTNIEDFVFQSCYSLQTIICLPTTPPVVGVIEHTYSDKICNVYVPYGCKKRYQAVEDGWLSLSYIRSIIMLGKGQTDITTIEAEDDFLTDYSTDMTDDEGNALDLEDAVAGGVYYNLKSDDGEGFDTTENCLIINNTTSEEDMDAIVSQGFDSESHESIKNQFSGLIIQVNGKGTIEIVCKTLGTGQLTVRIGDGAPVPYSTQDESATISVNFDVAEPTCIYIYASEMDVAPSVNGYRMMNVRRSGSSAGDNSVMIYQLSVVPFVEVSGLFGDANEDSHVTVADVMLTVNKVLGKTLTTFNERNADVNSDGKINVSDVMGIVKIVLSGGNSSAPSNATQSLSDAMAVTSKGSELTLHLTGTGIYTASQMTVTLPEGCRLESAQMVASRSNGHNVLTSDLGNGHYRVVIYSASGLPFGNSCSDLLCLRVAGHHNGDVAVSDIQMVDPLTATVLLSDVSGIATGIDSLSADTDGNGDWYTTQGQKVSTKTRGIYIRNGRKVVVR